MHSVVDHAVSGTRATCALAQRTFSATSWLEMNMVLRNFTWLTCLLIPVEPTLAQAKCFSTVSEVNTNNVRTRRLETTEND
jgi:hypothetical protein